MYHTIHKLSLSIDKRCYYVSPDSPQLVRNVYLQLLAYASQRVSNAKESWKQSLFFRFLSSDLIPVSKCEKNYVKEPGTLTFHCEYIWADSTKSFLLYNQPKQT